MSYAFPLNNRPLLPLTDNNRIQLYTTDFPGLRGVIFVSSEGKQLPTTIC